MVWFIKSWLCDLIIEVCETNRVGGQFGLWVELEFFCQKTIVLPISGPNWT